jgi:hypothetical protein
MGSHDLMMTETLCWLQNRAAAACSSIHGGAIATSPGLRLARPTADGLGCEEIEMERRARGPSQACSQSLGRCLDRAATVRSSTPIQLVVVTSSGPLVEWWGKMESPHLGKGPHASGEAWGMVVGRDGNGAQALFL